MGRAVRSRNSRSIKDKRDARLVQSNVHEKLVESAVQERRVQGDNGMRALVGHACSGGDRLSLRDAHIDHATRVGLVHGTQTNRQHHRGSNPDDIRARRGLGADLVREDAGPAKAFRGDGQARLRVNRANGMEAISDVFLGGLVTASLLRDDVNDNGFFEHPRTTQSCLHGGDIVPVHRTDVFEAQILEHDLRQESILESSLQAVQCIVGGAPRRPVAKKMLLTPRKRLLVASGGAQRVQVVSEAADSRSVGATVVIDDDDNAAVLRGRDVVEGLPRQATRERAITDDADRPRAFPMSVFLA